MLHDFFEGYASFEQCGVDSSVIETLRRVDLLCRDAQPRGAPLPEKCELASITAWVEQRRRGVPWEYVLGKAPFMGRLFHCSSDTLVPTEETCLLVNVASEAILEKERLGSDLTLIEVGTGCGNVAVSIALRTQHTRILASDLCAAAVEVARQNVCAFNLQERITLLCGDLFTPFQSLGCAGKVDFVVCNPPYIPTASLKKLPPEVLDHQPRLALDGGPFGIDFYRRLIDGAVSLLKPEGTLLFEIGDGQEGLVNLLFRNRAYREVSHFQGAARTRVVRATKEPIAADAIEPG